MDDKDFLRRYHDILGEGRISNSTPFLDGLDWDHFYTIGERRSERFDAHHPFWKKDSDRIRREAAELVELLLHKNPQRDPIDVCAIAYEMFMLWSKLCLVDSAKRFVLAFRDKDLERVADAVYRVVRWLDLMLTISKHLSDRFQEFRNLLYKMPLFGEAIKEYDYERSTKKEAARQEEGLAHKVSSGEFRS